MLTPRTKEFHGVESATIRYIDLFCGIGGFRFGIEAALRTRGLAGECAFSSDIDPAAREAYAANFGEYPSGDITEVSSDSIPDHDILLGGFPCQPFSIIGDAKGFEDTRGTLFFDIARILEAKRPAAFILENVKQLVGHDHGRTISRILETLDRLHYTHSHRILNALDFGLPQKRERVFIVGFRESLSMEWPLSPLPMRPLAEVLESTAPERFYASDYIRRRRLAARAAKGKSSRPNDGAAEPTIWHENKSGNVSAHPFSCALRAGASHNYLLVNGERRFTPREMLRLQGFPEEFRIVGTDREIRKQTGNAVPVPMVESVACRVLDTLMEARRRPDPVGELLWQTR